MKKLTLLFGAVLFASFTLTSCGNSMDSDAQKAADYTCKATALMEKVMNGDEDAQAEAEKLQAEMKPFQEELEKKYTTPDQKAEFQAAVVEKSKDCK